MFDPCRMPSNHLKLISVAGYYCDGSEGNRWVIYELVKKNILSLSCVGTLPSFSTMLSKGDNFRDCVLLTWRTKTSQNEVYS